MISLIHPSRSRPQKSAETSSDWVTRAGVETELIVSVDRDDPYIRDYVSLYGGKVLINENTCVVQAANHAARVAKFDVLVYLSDDFKCFDNWGVEVLKHFEGVNKPLLIKADDKLQAFNKDVLTIPIMNRALYNELGYFFHPAYKSMFVDQSLYWTVKNMDAMKLCPELVFEHHHYVNGKTQNDETYKRSTANWEQGKQLYMKHKAQNFPPYKKD
jgi:hypothetical protein